MEGTVVAASAITQVRQAWQASSAAARRYMRVLLAIGAGNTLGLFVAPLLALKVLDSARPGQGPELLGGVPATVVFGLLLAFVPLLAVYWRWFSKALVISTLTTGTDGVSLEYLGGKGEEIPWRRVRALSLYSDKAGRARFIAISYRAAQGTRVVHLPQCLYDLAEVWAGLAGAAPSAVAVREGRAPVSSLPQAAGIASLLAIGGVTAVVAALRLFL